MLRTVHQYSEHRRETLLAFANAVRYDLLLAVRLTCSHANETLKHPPSHTFQSIYASICLGVQYADNPTNADVEQDDVKEIVTNTVKRMSDWIEGHS